MYVLIKVGFCFVLFFFFFLKYLDVSDIGGGQDVYSLTK